MARKDKAPKPAPAETPPAPDASRSGSRFLRLFLTIAGGLAAPALALAAFFLSGHSGHTGAKTAQLGGITITTRPGSTATTRTPATTATSTTTTTTAPGPVAPPTRDPFAPLVNTAPATPGK